MKQPSVSMAASAAGLVLFLAAVLPTPAQNGAIPAPEVADGGLNRGRTGASGKAGPVSPAPHHADGRVNLGPAPGERGVWEGTAGMSLATSRPGEDDDGINLPTNMSVEEIPFRPWARALYNYRRDQGGKDDPHVRCKASGGSRLYHTPYGTEFIDSQDEQKIYILGVGGPHTYRTVFMDGREHPADLDPSFSGHAVGHWEGETLVIDTVGYNERFWLTRAGMPHTERLHLIERFTRTDYNTLRYEATVDDPGAYTEPWSGGWFMSWQDGEEMDEYICQENNRDIQHMYGPAGGN